MLRIRKSPKTSNTDHVSNQLTKDIWGKFLLSAHKRDAYRSREILLVGIGTDLDDIQDVGQYFASVLCTNKHLLSGVRLKLQSLYKIPAWNRYTVASAMLYATNCRYSCRMPRNLLYSHTSLHHRCYPCLRSAESSGSSPLHCRLFRFHLRYDIIAM